MKTVAFPTPPKDMLETFIVESNAIENIDIQYQEIYDTFAKKWVHPIAAGHFMAIDYTIRKLASDHNFPSKHSSQFFDKDISDKNLYWLRDVHLKLFSLVPKMQDRFPKIDQMSIHDCGNYRIKNTYIIQYSTDFENESDPLRPFPKFNKINDLMHYWYSELGRYHLKYAPKLEKPSSITFKEWEELSDRAYEFHMMLQCIHPWQEGTGRAARLIENALRLRWGLGWKTIKSQNSQSYIKDIRTYENSNKWQDILKQYDAKPERK